jgi:hypothetical protein
MKKKKKSNKVKGLKWILTKVRRCNLKFSQKKTMVKHKMMSYKAEWLDPT